MDAWEQIVDLNNRIFKRSGPLEDSMQFYDSIQTDGVSVTIIKQNKDTKNKYSAGHKRKDAALSTEFQYIHGINKEALTQTVGKCVLIDSHRRDLMNCMHENSKSNDRKIFKYTSNQRHKDIKDKRYRR
ncbi:hypothetical protein BDF19DRAFT_475189, partial [Syncephalis fuscata]